MVWTKQAMVFLWLGGNILDHNVSSPGNNIPSSLLALSFLDQFLPSSWIQGAKWQQH